MHFFEKTNSSANQIQLIQNKISNTPNRSPISAWNFSNDYMHHERVIEHRRISLNHLQQQQDQHQPISFQLNRWQLARAAQYQLKD